MQEDLARSSLQDTFRHNVENSFHSGPCFTFRSEPREPLPKPVITPARLEWLRKKYRTRPDILERILKRAEY
jgi:hypothetical protein